MTPSCGLSTSYKSGFAHAILDPASHSRSPFCCFSCQVTSKCKWDYWLILQRFSLSQDGLICPVCQQLESQILQYKVAVGDLFLVCYS